MYYLLFYDVVPNYVERRAPYRAEHLQLALQAEQRGELLLGGALADPPDGAILLFQADSPDVVQDFVDRDPYVKNGLITQWSIRPWTVVAGAGAPRGDW